jgi:hypothetical protein
VPLACSTRSAAPERSAPAGQSNQGSSTGRDHHPDGGRREQQRRQVEQSKGARFQARAIAGRIVFSRSLRRAGYSYCRASRRSRPSTPWKILSSETSGTPRYSAVAATQRSARGPLRRARDHARRRRLAARRSWSPIGVRATRSQPFVRAWHQESPAVSHPSLLCERQNEVRRPRRKNTECVAFEAAD